MQLPTRMAKLLMQAHKAAGGEDYCGEPDEVQEEPMTSEPYQQLMDLANKNRKKDETVEQAFASLYSRSQV
jgi:hypothetical protein